MKKRNKTEKLVEETIGQTKGTTVRQRNMKIIKAEEWKMGTWNVRSLNGKENEVELKFEEEGLNILT